MNQPVVLVVDDDALIGRTLTSYIRSLDLTAVHMPDGVAAQQWLMQHTTSLLLTDLEMPQMDGWQLCQMMVKQSNGNNHLLPPIIVMTALLHLNTPPPACKAVLYKPFELSELETVLRRFLPLTVDTLPPTHTNQRIDAPDTLAGEIAP